MFFRHLLHIRRILFKLFISVSGLTILLCLPFTNCARILPGGGKYYPRDKGLLAWARSKQDGEVVICTDSRYVKERTIRSVLIRDASMGDDEAGLLATSSAPMIILRNVNISDFGLSLLSDSERLEEISFEISKDEKITGRTYYFPKDETSSDGNIFILLKR